MFRDHFVWGSRKPTVSVIVPTLNEAKNLPLVLPYIPRDIVDEVILVDGRSTDNTVQIAQMIMPDIRIVCESKPGKGAAMRRGYYESTGDILIVLDADGSNDPREIPRFVDALMHGADFAKGSRFATLGGTTDMPLLRKLGNWGLVLLSNILFAQQYSDLCYGFHAFWRHCIEYIDLDHVDGFEVDTSLYLQAIRKKLKVVEVPSFEGFRFYGVGKLQTFPDGWRVLRTIFKEWITSVRHPAQSPQIGFRSYGLSPFISSLINTTGQQEIPACLVQKSYRLEDLFKERVLLASEEELKQMVPQMLLFAIESLGASSGSLLLFDPELNVTQGCHMFGRNVHEINVCEIAETVQTGAINWVIQNREPVIIENTQTDARWQRRNWEEQENVSRSVLFMPFVVHDQLLAVISLARPEDRSFLPEDLSRLMQVAVKV
jgi:hypothetical protein